MSNMAADLGGNEAIDPTTLFTKQECIGGGSFGKVYKGLDRRTGHTVAIKVIDVENAEDEVEDIMGEIMILSGMSSPYVTRYYGSYLHGSDLWIVMEFCSGGSCADLMKPGLIAEAEIAVIVKELLQGLMYLHDDGKLHRDIKGLSYTRWDAVEVLMCGSGEHSRGCEWTGQTRGLWCLGPAFGDDDEEEHVRWHAVLDGARGYQAVWI
jgi:serine/threonine protein kinase